MPTLRLAMRSRSFFFGAGPLTLFALLATTILVYLPGLNGPFLFDDVPNLTPLADWLTGVTGWQEALRSSHSGFLGRPLSMLTFLLDAAAFGMAPLSFKLTNLAIHLACGAAVYSLMRGLLVRDPHLSTQSGMLALAISAVWLLHPMQVSTVLYIVQRMEQLSALFVLLALLAYVRGRRELEVGRWRRGILWLFLAMPAATGLALLCKENGVLAPVFCAAIELGYFSSTTRRPAAVRLFFALSLVLPAAAIATWLAIHPGWLPASFSGRNFSLGERLLTEPRVMFDYMGALLVPRGPSLGLYQDGYTVSTGLLQPPATLAALAGLALLIATAVLSRRRAPAVFTGLLFYLGGHVMESTALPLELYFEHRNYLPAAGFFLATIGGIATLARRSATPASDARRTRALAGALAMVCLVLAVATAARAWVWQSWTTIVEQAAAEHPESTRAQLDYAGVLWNLGKLDETGQVFQRLEQSRDPVAQHMAAVYSVKLSCERDGAVDAAGVQGISTISGSMLQLAEMEAFDRLANYLDDHPCVGVTRSELASILSAIADNAPQPATQTQVWRTRFRAARLFMDDGNYRAGIVPAEKAWAQGTPDTAVGIVLSNLYYLNGDLASARRVLSEARGRMASWDVRNQKLAAKLQALYDSASEAPHDKEGGDGPVPQPG